eukprot:6074701-Heterocapsa_arctica.AAC.1
MTAEIIDWNKRDSTRDTNKLVKHKYGEKPNTCFCEQDNNENRVAHCPVDYNKWNYKRKRSDKTQRICSGCTELEQHRMQYWQKLICTKMQKEREDIIWIRQNGGRYKSWENRTQSLIRVDPNYGR